MPSKERALLDALLYWIVEGYGYMSPLSWDYADWYDVINEYNQKTGSDIAFSQCHEARRVLCGQSEMPTPVREQYLGPTRAVSILVKYPDGVRRETI